ncbi:MAG: hypothetical protein ACRDXX_16035 [Stackebrandtia sp.]
MSAVRRGEFRKWRPAGRDDVPARWVLVISDDDFNAAVGSWPLCVQVIRRGRASPYLAALGDTEPVAGRLSLPSLGPVPLEHLGETAGMISHPAYDHLIAGLRTLLGVPD